MHKNAREALEQIRKSTINYLYQKQQQEDWHGVADAAMDLREIDAKLEILEVLDKPLRVAKKE
jgi:hypothetical protein